MGVPQSFDRFALDYDRFVSLLPGQNTTWLLALGLKGKRALDAGCGPGHAAAALADSFEYVIGLDLSGPLIEIAEAKQARPNVHYAVGDLFDFTDEDGFDLVYSHTMLHHLQDYRAGLEHLRNLVRPGGTVALIDNVCDRYPTPPRKAYTWPARWTSPARSDAWGLATHGSSCASGTADRGWPTCSAIGTCPAGSSATFTGAYSRGPV